MTKPGHRRFGLFAHITWHTWRRQRVVRHDDVPIITRSILDAAANRAREGLRVVEDYVRFTLDDRHLTSLLKNWRHRLADVLSSIDSRGLQC